MRHRRREGLIALTVGCAAAHAVVLSFVATPLPESNGATAPVLSVRSVASPVPAAFDGAALTTPTPLAKTAPKAQAVSRSAPALIERPAPSYVSSNGLDMPPMPRSAPDASVVEGVAHSGMPIRLRLYVEVDGTVSAVEVLSVYPDDELATERLVAMFRATAFSPGRLRGVDVATYLDIEVASLPRPLAARAD